MKAGKGLTFRFLNGAAELCWVYAVAAFSMTAISRGAFSFVAAVSVFVFSAFITGVSHGKGWRVIWVVGLQLLSIICCVLWGTYLNYYSSLPFLDGRWIWSIFRESRTTVQWLAFTFTNIWAILFWLSGRALVLRKPEYYAACTRFDIGLTAFFCILLTRMIFLYKAGLHVQDSYSFSLIFPFFVFSLLLIGTSRIEHQASKSFLRGYRTVSIIATFMIVVVLYSGAVFLFCLPFLHAAADTGYTALKGGAGFILPVVETILRFVFMGRRMREDPAQKSSSPDESAYSSISHGPVSQFFEKMMKWGIEVFAGILIFAGCCLVIYFLVKWLLSRTEHVTGEKRKKGQGLFGLIRLWNQFFMYIKRILVRMKGYNTASEFYMVLGEWGKHSGCTRLAFETPREFCEKLSFCFPHLSMHFDLIITLLHKECYAEQALSGGEIREIRTTWRRLRSPRYWLARVRSRLLQKD